MTGGPADIAIDGRGIVRDWPASAAELFGYERSRALGCALTALILPARLHDIELPRDAVDAPVVHRDGHEFRAELSVRDAEHSHDGGASCGSRR